jgi:hypothetical protein
MRLSITSALAFAAAANAAVIRSTDTVLDSAGPLLQYYDRSMVDILQGNVECKKYIVIFARGTFEPFGKAGGPIVGDRFIDSLKSLLPGQVAAEGVKYKNGVGGYLTGGNEPGIDTFAQMARDALKQCPESKLILGGYR